jgi:hypothetical protein
MPALGTCTQRTNSDAKLFTADTYQFTVHPNIDHVFAAVIIIAIDELFQFGSCLPRGEGKNFVVFLSPGN